MVLTDDLLDDFVVETQDNIDAEFTHGAIGTDGSSESATDSSLGSEVFRNSRQSVSDGNVSGGSGDTTCSMFVASTEANGNDIKEHGWFDASSGGTMQSRDTLSTAVSKTNDIELFFDVTVEIDVTQP